MNLQIVDQFTDFLCSFSNLTSTTIAVKILKWASENPEQAKELIDSFAKLNTTAKRDFSLRLLAWGTAPEVALAQTIKWQKEQHDRRSILSTVLAAIRKGEYDYLLPNGVHCRIAKRADEYFRFTFCVCGKNVVVVYHRSLRLGEALDNLKYNQIYGFRMMEVSFDGHDYPLGSTAALKIFDAVSKNIDPYVHAVVEK